MGLRAPFGAVCTVTAVRTFGRLLSPSQEVGLAAEREAKVTLGLLPCALPLM